MGKELNEPISEAKVKEGTYRLLAILFQVLANPARIEILDLLRHNPPEKTFSDVMFTLEKNPHVVSHHLHRLRCMGLSRKRKTAIIRSRK